ncbi:MAG: DUF2971 domain-containing protein [Alphaproteobacteria bacterium]|nr:DUF2971 domain-containing protein [Alphaproteobacteria bacterium]
MSDVLYKYIKSRDAAENLLQGSLKFTPVSELNDPNEMFDDFDENEVRRTRQVIVQNGISNEEFFWLKKQEKILRRAGISTGMNVPRDAKSAVKIIQGTHVDGAIRYHKMTVEKLRRQCGVLSLSERFDGMPMWAHYGNMGAGFVVMFQNLREIFSDDSTSLIGHLSPVEYHDTIRMMDFVPSSVRYFFLSKLKDWSYEREWRVILPLKECDSNGNIYLKSIDPSYVSGVILGWKCVEEDRVAILDAVASTNPKATVQQAKIVRGKIELLDISTHSVRQQ